jgi:hypothetical protein
MISSEKLTEAEPWGKFGQDELVICDPADPDHPRIERLLGDRADAVEFVPLDSPEELGRLERGRWAEERARAELERS